MNNQFYFAVPFIFSWQRALILHHYTLIFRWLYRPVRDKWLAVNTVTCYATAMPITRLFGGLNCTVRIERKEVFGVYDG